MNKQELIASIAEKVDLAKSAVETVLNATIESIKEELGKDGKVVLVGFGTFGVKKRSARTGRNPQTGKVIQIPAKNVPEFKAGKELKEAVE